MIELLVAAFPQYSGICRLYAQCINDSSISISIDRLQELLGLSDIVASQQRRYISAIMGRFDNDNVIYGSEFHNYLCYVNDQCRKLAKDLQDTIQLYQRYCDKDRQSEQSLYCIIDKTSSQLLYIGRTNNFNRRKQEHTQQIERIQEFFKNDMKYVVLAGMNWQDHTIQFKQIGAFISGDDIQTAETAFIQKLNPILNTKQTIQPKEIQEYFTINIDKYKLSNARVLRK